MKLVTTYLLLLFSAFCFAQKNHKFVTIKEKINGKRIELFAENTDNKSYDVFLMVNTQDFRKSSSRPTIKTVPANGRIKMITLIKLVGKEGKYDYKVVVNEKAGKLKVKKDKNELLKINDSLSKQNLNP